VVELPIADVTEVLEKANECWSKSKNDLTKLELENFTFTNHIFAENINIAKIPTIKKKSMFILHSLPDFDNDQLIIEGYVQKEKLLELRNKVMNNSWFFLIGTSGSGKTRSLFELFCQIYGIYFTINAENGLKMNLGSKDLDIAINELENYLTINHEKNTRVALRFTRAMILGRLFILNKLLEIHSNFTPKQWLLMQLLPCTNQFWISISYIFRNLKEEDQNILITDFTEKFKNLIHTQEHLPIAIDES
ncbi:31047_t:CDS:2, partial [Racocetra persica]